MENTSIFSINELIESTKNELSNNSIEFSNDYYLNELNNSNDISDYFYDFCDSNVDIYHSDLANWVKENNESADYMERVINELLYDTHNYNFWGHVRCAQFQQILDDLYNDIDNVCLLLILHELKSHEVKEIDIDYLLEIESAAGSNGVYEMQEVIETLLKKESEE